MKRKNTKQRYIMTPLNINIHDDPYPPIHAMVMEDEVLMLNHLDIYRNPNTRFRVTTWRGGRVMTPLGNGSGEHSPGLEFP